MKKITLLAFAATISSFASAELFDFETAIIANTASFSQTSGNLTVTVSRSSGTGFTFTNLSGIGVIPASWGSRSLAPFFNFTDDWFIADFSSAVSSVSISFGDFGVDDDDTGSMVAYSGAGATGLVVDSASNSWGTRDMLADAPDVIGVSGAGIMSVAFRGGSVDFPQSLYWDNLEAQAVPEPMTMSLLGLGAVALLRRKRA